MLLKRVMIATRRVDIYHGSITVAALGSGRLATRTRTSNRRPAGISPDDHNEASYTML